MRDWTSAAAISIEMEKGKHVIAASTATVSITPPVVSISEYLPIFGVLIGAVASAFVIYKTYLEIKIKKIELANIERRKS